MWYSAASYTHRPNVINYHRHQRIFSLVPIKLISCLVSLFFFFFTYTSWCGKKFMLKNRNKRPGRSLTSHWPHLLRFISSSPSSSPFASLSIYLAPRATHIQLPSCLHVSGRPCALHSTQMTVILR